MDWTIRIEGRNGAGDVSALMLRLQCSLQELQEGRIGLSLEEGKQVVAALQRLVVRSQMDEYALARRVCPHCLGKHRLKERTKRRIRTVWGTVEVDNPRLFLCPCVAFAETSHTPLAEVCPGQATPELLELTARLGATLPYRQAARLLSDLLPCDPPSHATVRNRTLAVGRRLEQQVLARNFPEDPAGGQLELVMPADTAREFTVSIDGGFVRSSHGCEARTMEVWVARCGRGLRASRLAAGVPGHEYRMRSRILEALEREGYRGRGEISVLSDGDDMLRRIPPMMPTPVTHILDWHHIAMKLQPMMAMAETMATQLVAGEPSWVDLPSRIRSIKSFLWHGRSAAALLAIRRLIVTLGTPAAPVQQGSRRLRLFSATRKLRSYIAANRSALQNYGERHRAGQRVSTSSAESAVNQVIGHRMGKRRQMRWSPSGAHLMLQVRTAVLNGDLAERMRPLYAGIQPLRITCPKVAA